MIQNDQKNRDSGLIDHSEITYLRDIKKQVNFSFVQSLALCAAYIAGMNKESTDVKLFDVTARRKHHQQQREQQGKPKEQKQLMVGRSKRFSTDRYLAIIDYLMPLVAPEVSENKLIGHSLDLLATLNSLCDDNLLKKSIAKKSDSNLDDLSQIAFKCNFDEVFVRDVAKKINFEIDEYLI